MGTKRAHGQLVDEVEGQRKQPRTENTRPQTQRAHVNKKPRTNGPSHGASTAVNPLKKKIRDLSRLLEHSQSLPAGLRIETERALAGYRQQLAAADSEKRRQKMIKKYHMVRFFERQKATRILKKLRKRLTASESTSEKKGLETQIAEAEVDLNYTLYCPLSEKYISLYATRDDEVDDGSGSAARQKPPLWQEVRKRTVEGGLEALLHSNDGASGHQGRANTLSKPEKSTKPPTETNRKRKGKPDAVEEKIAEADNSDGGFFEE
ncbi:MAG: 18S rRNA maturation protein [Caeruleum heppii]|nr:MAG: 18S rRNA maturation protein [Caeruleum heppii]